MLKSNSNSSQTDGDLSEEEATVKCDPRLYRANMGFEYRVTKLYDCENVELHFRGKIHKFTLEEIASGGLGVFLDRGISLNQIQVETVSNGGGFQLRKRRFSTPTSN
tara:strand:- start:895 stop:1215 length:321 start_codon:yes stop_codon:yes gene_type:complete